MLDVLVVLFHVGFTPHGRFALDSKGRSFATSLCGASQLLLDMSLPEVHITLTHMAAAPLRHPSFPAVCNPTFTVRVPIASSMLDVYLTELPVIPAAAKRRASSSAPLCPQRSAANGKRYVADHLQWRIPP